MGNHRSLCASEQKKNEGIQDDVKKLRETLKKGDVIKHTTEEISSDDDRLIIRTRKNWVVIKILPHGVLIAKKGQTVSNTMVTYVDLATEQRAKKRKG